MRKTFYEHTCDCCNGSSQPMPVSSPPTGWIPLVLGDNNYDVCSIECAVKMLAEFGEDSPLIRIEAYSEKSGIPRDYDH